MSEYHLLYNNISNNNSIHLYSTYYVPDSVLNYKYIFYVVLIKTLWYKDYYYPHFIEQEVETQEKG